MRNLKSGLIDKLMRYIDKDKMRYDMFKKQGHCIGSGAIESANKFVVQRRLKLPGIRWEPENAEYMAHLRALYNYCQPHKQLGVLYVVDNLLSPQKSPKDFCGLV